MKWLAWLEICEIGLSSKNELVYAVWLEEWWAPRDRGLRGDYRLPSEIKGEVMHECLERICL